MLINILKFAISEGLAKLAPFLTTLYVAKLLTPDLFGRYTLIVVAFEILFILISFNIQATTRIDFFKEEPPTFKKTKQSHFQLSLIIACIACVSLLFFQGTDRVVLLVLLLSALLRTYSVFILAVFQCCQKVNYYVVVNVTFVCLLSFFTLLFLELGASYFSWAYAILGASTLQLLLAVKLYGFHRFRSLLCTSFDLNALKITIVPAALFMPQAIGWWLKNGAERFLIEKYLGAEVLGNYALTFQLSSLQIIGVTTLNLAIVPLVNKRLKEKNYQYVVALLAKISIVILVGVVVAYFLISWGIPFMYGSKYQLARELVPLFCLSNLFQALMLLYINVLYYENDGAYVAKVIFTAFFLQFAIALFLLSFAGGGVKAVLICSAFFNVAVCFLIGYRIMKKTPAKLKFAVY